MKSGDATIERLARLFRTHPAWCEAARMVDQRSTSNVFFTHRPGEPWHLERCDDETLLLPGAASDPDFVFRFAPGAIERLESAGSRIGDFAAELVTRMMSEDAETRVDLRIAVSFPRLLRRGYVRLLLAAGPRLRAIGAARGISGVQSLARLVARMRKPMGEPWEADGDTDDRGAPSSSGVHPSSRARAPRRRRT
jgi:hypothetical protein